MKNITISGIIGWDVEAIDIRQALEAAGGEPVQIIISSPGGLVSEMLEMYNLIRNYEGATTARLAGFAMSAASYIPLAADEIIAEDNAVYMIHNVHGGVFGDHNYILKYGRHTEALSRMIAGAYARHTGRAAEEITRLMDDETFYYGQEIVDAGFAHALVEAADDQDGDKTARVAEARSQYAALATKLSADAHAAAADVHRAVALARPADPHRAAATRPAKTHQGQQQEQPMDLKTLKEKHSDLVAAITDEATAAAEQNTEEKLAEARKQGAEDERQRIADVRAQLIPGHEELIETMAFDGQSDGDDAARAIIKAEQAAAGAAADELDDEANAAVPSAQLPENDSRQMKRADFNTLSTDKQRAFVSDGGQVID